MVQPEAVELLPCADADADDQERKSPLFSSQTVHLIRTAQVNTLTLSQMADQKAHILIGASFVVFSLVITQTANSPISWSTICLATTAMLATICAVVAILPRAGPKTVETADFNHLFFGHFALMDEERWACDVLDKSRTDQDLYRMMLRDLHQNGKVLQIRKFRFLAYAYQTFLAGLVLTLMIYMFEAAAQMARLPG